MSIKVLVVDDSKLFRRFVSEALSADPDIEIVGTASDGLEAVRLAKTLKPNVITMDVEMPRMDGIQAVRKIMREAPVPILMFSSLTHEGAKATMEALEAGAADFLPKKYGDLSSDKSESESYLRLRVKELASQVKIRPVIEAETTGFTEPVKTEFHRVKRFKLVVLAASTGGPMALQKILAQLPENFPCPIIIVQHIPPSFSTAFAERANQTCALEVKELQDKETIESGYVYVAPGGKQLEVEREGRQVRCRIIDPKPTDAFKPCIDDALFSISEVYGAATLAVILTGMGNDGLSGCKVLKRRGGHVWAQDNRTSVVDGMPAAIREAGLSDKVWSLSLMAQKIAEEF